MLLIIIVPKLADVNEQLIPDFKQPSIQSTTELSYQTQVRLCLVLVLATIQAKILCDKEIVFA